MTVPLGNDLALLNPIMGAVVLVATIILLAFVVRRMKKVLETRVKLANAELFHSVARETEPTRWNILQRKLVPVLVLGGLVIASIGVANPATAVSTATEEAHLCLILDRSLSMAATDVEPTRIDAVKAAATETIRNAPADLKVTVVAFASSEDVDVVIEPSLNRDEALTRIDQLQLADGTALGEGIYTALGVIQSLEDSPLRSAEELSKGEEPPVSCIALSDGASVDGRPAQQAAQAAQELGVPVHTVAFGTDDGLAPVNGRLIAAKPDRENLKQVAELTGGEFYEAVSESQLEEVFGSVAAKVTTEVEFQSVGYAFSGAGILLVIAGLVLFTRKHGLLGL